MTNRQNFNLQLTFATPPPPPHPDSRLGLGKNKLLLRNSVFFSALFIKLQKFTKLYTPQSILA